jgi:hypothetical protein
MWHFRDPRHDLLIANALYLLKERSAAFACPSDKALPNEQARNYSPALLTKRDFLHE